jgi:hypothetical protein
MASIRLSILKLDTINKVVRTRHLFYSVFREWRIPQNFDGSRRHRAYPFELGIGRAAWIYDLLKDRISIAKDLGLR